MEAAWITEQRNNFSVVVILCANKLPNFKLEWKNEIYPSYYGGMSNSDFCVGSNAYESLFLNASFKSETVHFFNI